MHLQQSILYQNYINKLGWQVVKIDGQAAFLKHIPFLGNLAKLQRPHKLPKSIQLIQFIHKYHISRLAIEPEYNTHQIAFTRLLSTLQPHVRLNSSPFLPTKTILVDLAPTEDEIFSKFTEAKRRAVRRAGKNNVEIRQSSDIAEFIRIKNKSAGFLGFITTHGCHQLWETFVPQNATILLAYQTTSSSPKSALGGILLLFHDSTAYYWIAGATRTGKKLFAPTLLVWESLKLSKTRGMRQLDLVGVWDERLPEGNKQWLGFTKFKEGFGGNEIYYPIAKVLPAFS